MKAAKRKAVTPLSDTTATLLRELSEECERVVELVQRLDGGGHSARELDEILGELSAAVLHLHAHTKGLDRYLCERA
jgi:hypothetical protein